MIPDPQRVAQIEDEEITLFLCRNRQPPCDHEFTGWRAHEDGRGGEQVCAKCDIGAMEWSMRFLS